MFCWLRLSSRDARPGSTNENSRVSVIKRSRKKQKKNKRTFLVISSPVHLLLRTFFTFTESILATKATQKFTWKKTRSSWSEVVEPRISNLHTKKIWRNLVVIVYIGAMVAWWFRKRTCVRKVGGSSPAATSLDMAAKAEVTLCHNDNKSPSLSLKTHASRWETLVVLRYKVQRWPEITRRTFVQKQSSSLAEFFFFYIIFEPIKWASEWFLKKKNYFTGSNI